MKTKPKFQWRYDSSNQCWWCKELRGLVVIYWRGHKAWRVNWDKYAESSACLRTDSGKARNFTSKETAMVAAEKYRPV